MKGFLSFFFFFALLPLKLITIYLGPCASECFWGTLHCIARCHIRVSALSLWLNSVPIRRDLKVNCVPVVTVSSLPMQLDHIFCLCRFACTYWHLRNPNKNTVKQHQTTRPKPSVTCSTTLLSLLLIFFLIHDWHWNFTCTFQFPLAQWKIKKTHC